MKYKSISILLLISAFLISANNINNNESVDSAFLVKYTSEILSECPSDNSENRDILESFLTHTAWSSERQNTGTTNLSVSQILVLNDNNHQNTCQNLNADLEETVSETHNSGNKKYNITYYKISSFYFAVITLNQPSDPDIVSVGLSYLIIYDSNLNTIQGYSF